MNLLNISAKKVFLRGLSFCLSVDLLAGLLKRHELINIYNA